MNPYYRIYSEESIAAEYAETLADAQARAEELAAKHPGRAFEILKCVGYTSTSKVSTFWTDGEEPPEKPRYRMIEEGEVILEGDEWQSDSGEWRGRLGGFGKAFSTHHHTPHRRPL